jgi:hypothetical protein
MAEGWYLVSAPIITANWEADSDDTWTVPVGGIEATVDDLCHIAQPVGAGCPEKVLFLDAPKILKAGEIEVPTSKTRYVSAISAPLMIVKDETTCDQAVGIGPSALTQS